MKAWSVTAKGQTGQEETEAVSGMYRGWLKEATCATKRGCAKKPTIGQPTTLWDLPASLRSQQDKVLYN